MSVGNRKAEYDRLVKLGRFKDIPQDLLKEFGEVSQTSKPKAKKATKKVTK